MAEWTTAYINDLPDSAFACVSGDKRLYPHHDASGKVDMPHMRAAMSRIGDPNNDQCGKGHLDAHAKAEGMGAMKATLLDDDSFRLLAIPFGGPIPSTTFSRGVDQQFETFTERTDVKASWLPQRVVDWHHGDDALMRRTPIGKAIDPYMDEDGWWVTVWLDHGERRLQTIQHLAERAKANMRADIFGSAESVAGMTRKAAPVRDGNGFMVRELLVWPYWRQTLSTSPVNTHSVLRPLKASVDDLYANGVTPTAAFWADLSADLDNLQSDLRRTSLAGDDVAKAGLEAAQEVALRKAIDELATVLVKLEKAPA